MKLYQKYKNILSKKSIGKLEKAYFTTFNIDISFVEKYILAPLLGDSIPDNKFSLEDLNLGLMQKDKADIKFFYDANMLASLDKRTLIQTYPILVKGGVFHPKVIYLRGTQATYLIVGSGNLTYSGWGRNIEAFQIIKLENKNLENQVLDFFDEVFELAGVNRERQTSRKPSFGNKLDFIYSFKNKTSNLLEHLHIKETLQIYSPYFSDDLDSLFKKDEFKTLTSINIIPDLIENKKIRLKKLPSDKRIKFYLFDKENISQENESSINHSKIWISDSKYAIGSHNCTEPALYGKNFEASLVGEYQNKDDFSLDDSIHILKPEITKKDDRIEEEEKRDNFSSLFKLVANYKNYSLELSAISEKINLKKIYINLPSFNGVYLKYKEFENLTSSKKVVIFRALVKNKIYEIYDDEKLLFRGIIIELNATQKTRFSQSAETLDDIFLSFLDEKNPTEASHLENMKIDIDRDDEHLYKRKNKQTSVNYFSMFSGFKNLNKRFEDIKDNIDKLERFCYSSASSLSVVKNVIEQYKDKESLFIHLTILEYNILVSKVNRAKMDGIKLQKIDEIDIKLSSEDKAFIKAMR